MGNLIHRFRQLLEEAIAAYEYHRQQGAEYIAATIIDHAAGILETDDGEEVFPLDAMLKDQLEHALGTDLTQVRIHTGSRAHSMAQAYDAAAVTLGNDIYFSNGGYEPDTSEGMELLVHEVQHAVQHNAGTRMIYAEEIEALEMEAASITERIAENETLATIERGQLSTDPYQIESTNGITDNRVSGILYEPWHAMADLRSAHSERPMIRYVGVNGSEILMTQQQYRTGIEKAVQRVQQELSEQRYSMTIEEYERSMIRIFEQLSMHG